MDDRGSETTSAEKTGPIASPRILNWKYSRLRIPLSGHGVSVFHPRTTRGAGVRATDTTGLPRICGRAMRHWASVQSGRRQAPELSGSTPGCDPDAEGVR